MKEHNSFARVTDNKKIKRKWQLTHKPKGSKKLHFFLAYRHKEHPKGLALHKSDLLKPAWTFQISVLAWWWRIFFFFFLLGKVAVVLLQHQVQNASRNEIHYLSFNELLLDLLNSHGGRHAFKGELKNREGVERCFCRIEMEDRQLKVLLLSLVFSLSKASESGSWRTAETWSALGRMQLQVDPMETYNGTYKIHIFLFERQETGNVAQTWKLLW